MKLAAIDIGSNAGRLAIYRAWRDQDVLKTHQVEFIRFPLRLGDSVFNEGFINEEKQVMLGKLFQAYAIMMDLQKVDFYRACATSALREASNSEDVLQALKDSTGIKLEVISGDQEAKLILKAHEHILGDLPEYLFVDVGGGSTELTYRNASLSTSATRSFDLGTIRILDGKELEADWENIHKWVEHNVISSKNLMCVGTGGNINKAFALSGVKSTKFLSFSGLQEVYNRLNSYSLSERINFLGLNPDRADVIIPALEIYLFIMEQAKATKMLVSGVSLRDGIINELLEKHNDEIK